VRHAEEDSGIEGDIVTGRIGDGFRRERESYEVGAPVGGAAYYSFGERRSGRTERTQSLTRNVMWNRVYVKRADDGNSGKKAAL
jgi:hypothetical protein